MITNQGIKGNHFLKIGDILTVFPVALLATSCTDN
jgi:(1->4)-alpha-D-glucan 1-alpha-D-glucosylmutase